MTHQFFEDLGIVRTIPGITVVVPADEARSGRPRAPSTRSHGPAYMRIGSGRDPVVDCDEVPFDRARSASSWTTDMTSPCLPMDSWSIAPCRRPEVLRQEGIRPVVVNVHTLKPLDREAIVGILEQTGAAVTVEDHNIIGGLGSAIAELSAEECPSPVIRVGLRDIYPRSGEPDALLDYFHMGVTDIVEAAKTAMRRRKR